MSSNRAQRGRAILGSESLFSQFVGKPRRNVKRQYQKFGRFAASF
jgi:hypothetical protein